MTSAEINIAIAQACGWTEDRLLPSNSLRNLTGRYLAKNLAASIQAADGLVKARRNYGFTTSKNRDSNRTTYQYRLCFLSTALPVELPPRGRVERSAGDKLG